jgi:hypothetical protein
MFRSLTAVTSPYFLVIWSSVTPAITRFSFPPSLGRCKGVLTRDTIDSSITSITSGSGCGNDEPWFRSTADLARPGTACSRRDAEAGSEEPVDYWDGIETVVEEVGQQLSARIGAGGEGECIRQSDRTG